MGFAVTQNKRALLIWRFRLARRTQVVLREVQAKLSEKLSLNGRVLPKGTLQVKIVEKLVLKGRIEVKG